MTTTLEEELACVVVDCAFTLSLPVRSLPRRWKKKKKTAAAVGVSGGAHGAEARGAPSRPGPDAHFQPHTLGIRLLLPPGDPLRSGISRGEVVGGAVGVGGGEAAVSRAGRHLASRG